MVKSTTNGRTDSDWMGLMNKSWLIWKRWSPNLVKWKREVHNILRISVTVSLEKVALWKTNSSVVDSSQTQGQEHLQGYCTEEETWMHFMGMKKTCILWDQSLVTLLPVISKERSEFQERKLSNWSIKKTHYTTLLRKSMLSQSIESYLS